jgi:SAM-dependent methyltransferase
MTSSDPAPKALALHAAGDSDAALELLFKNVEKAPDHAPSFGAIGRIFADHAEPMQAVEAFARAIQIDGFNSGYKQSFIDLVSAMEMEQDNPPLKAMVLECMQDEAVDFSAMGRLWHSLLNHDPAFKKNFAKIDLKSLLSPFFLKGLERIVVFDTGFEKFLTDLRHILLDQTDPALESLKKSLAAYCHATEYIFFVSKEEQSKIKPDNPLYFETRKPPKENIVAITPIGAGVSSAVQGQYEEFPYPQYSHIDSTIKDPELESFLSKGGIILNAGCGTGKEAIELAAAFPKAKVLGIDLSTASLSYGIRKAREFGIKNVEFKQADILALDKLGPFDFIASSGVLHHMEDPFAGFAKLHSILKPGGLMRIALYSRKAREPLNTAMKIIKEKGYGSDSDGIRQFRHDASQILPKDVFKYVCSFRDYFYLSECRDLLFHVQEHQMTIPEIKDMLDRLNLEFLKFYLRSDILKKYTSKFPQDPEARNLNNWDQFEAAEPETFKEMYRFWCRKAA